MSKAYHSKIEHFFGKSNLKSQYTGTDSIVKAFKADDSVTDLQNFEIKIDTLGFINSENSDELYRETNWKLLDIFKIEQTISSGVNELAALRAKTYAYTCDHEH